jgi:ankyrin repeat protein
MVREGVSPNVATSTEGAFNGHTALHAAAQEGRMNVVELLIKSGANVNARTPGGTTPLHLASDRNRLAVVNALLAAKADPNLLDYRGTPLHAALYQGNADLAIALLEHGADPNARSPYDGATPLMAVSGVMVDVYPERSALIRRLIAAGADVNARNDGGKTALDGARDDAVATLLAAGALPARYEGKRDALLPHAVLARDSRMVEDLLAGGADPNMVNERGEPATLLAARVGDVKILASLLDHGGAVDPDAKSPESLLYAAVKSGHPDVVDLLLARHASVNARDANGRTPLHALYPDCAWGDARKPAALRLLAAGADANITVGGDRSNPAHWCLSDTEMLATVIAHGADTNGREKGLMPLHLAAVRLNVPAMRELIRAKADVNGRTDNDETPLHVVATDHTHDRPMDAARTLIDAGADVTLRDRHGRTPVEVFRLPENHFKNPEYERLLAEGKQAAR